MSAARATFGLAQASRRWWVTLFVLVAASLYAYGTRGRMDTDVARFAGAAQGTTYHVVLGGSRSAATVAALQASVDSLLAVIDRSMSTYDSTSEISRFNRARSTAPMEISDDFAAVLATSLAVSRASGGAFDVTVGPLVDAWGFGAKGESGRVPSDSTLALLRTHVGWQKLRLDGHTLSKSHPQLEIDLNADAPGYTVDVISALLTSRGEPNHFVEVGGEVRARGQNAQHAPFRVGIEEPLPDVRRVRVVVGLADRSMATSGNYRDFQDIGGVRYTHILDPSTGAPVRHGLLSVSVLHRDCVWADAWATALFVVGPERAWALAAVNGLDVLLLVAGPHGEIQERMTDGFKAVVLRDDDPRAVDRTTRRSNRPPSRAP